MDEAILHLINERWTNPVLDLFMASISNIDIWRPFLILAGLCFMIWGGFRGRTFVVCLLLCLAVTEIGTSVLKNAIGRHRPKQVEHVRMVVLQRTRPELLTLFKRPTIRYSDETDEHRSGPSFPSGHTTNNTVIAMCSTLFYRRRGALYWIVAAAIGWSRIYLGAHWPSDVLGTALLATGEALLLIAFFELIWRKLGPRVAPNTFEFHPRLLGDRAV